MIIGEKLKSMVEKAVLLNIVSTQKDFARLLDIHEASLYRLFTMDSLKSKHIKKACEIVKISIEDFYREDNPSNLVAEPANPYITKSQTLVNEINQLKHELLIANNMIASLQEQLKLKEEIIALMKAK